MRAASGAAGSQDGDGGAAGEEGEDGGAPASFAGVQCAARRSRDSQFSPHEVGILQTFRRFRGSPTPICRLSHGVFVLLESK